jgi:DNA-binding transcriptional ArsR family regulator
MSQTLRRQEAEDGLSDDEIFDVLQNERRRYVLQYLRQHGGPVTLGDLASHVAAAEYDCAFEDVSSAQRKRVYTTLQQSHLPRMDEAGIIAYDGDEGVITTTPQTQELTVYLEIVPEGEFPWREYYLSFGAISLAVMVVLWAGVYPFTLIPPLVWATVMAALLTASALYHTFVARELTLTEYVDEADDADGNQG